MTRSLITPEGVDLQIKLADAGMRAAAFLLDAVILVAAAVAVTIVALFGLGGLGLRGLEPLFIGWIVLIFLLRNVYFIAFEASRRAATPGKRIVGIRVVSRAGAGLSIDQVIARNLMREIEVFLPLSMIAGRSGLGVADTLTTVFGLTWALLFAFFPLFNRDRMRIGDLLAGTWVVEAPRRALAEDLSARAGRRCVCLQHQAARRLWHRRAAQAGGSAARQRRQGAADGGRSDRAQDRLERTEARCASIPDRLLRRPARASRAKAAARQPPRRQVRAVASVNDAAAEPAFSAKAAGAA